MNFTPQTFLIEAIEGKNLLSIRVALNTYITKDLGGKDEEILNAAKYIEENYGDIWQQHDNREKELKENWDTTYLGLIQSDLMNNFSKERLNHILEVGSFIYHKDTKTIPELHTNDYNKKPKETIPIEPKTQPKVSKQTEPIEAPKTYKAVEPDEPIKSPIPKQQNARPKTTVVKKEEHMGKYLALAAGVAGLIMYLIVRD